MNADTLRFQEASITGCNSNASDFAMTMIHSCQAGAASLQVANVPDISDAVVSQALGNMNKSNGQGIG